MLKYINKLTNLFKSEQDIYLNNLVDNTYKSARVVGNGTLKIDYKEVVNSEEFKHATKRAEEIVKNANKN